MSAAARAPSRSLAIAGNDLALFLQEPIAVIVLVAMPLCVMAFGKPAYAAALASEGYPKANGAEQAVPGMALMFVFFMVTFAGLAFFREHIWFTWDRIRALPIGPREIMTGKIVLPFTLICLQQLLLFVIGGLLFHLRVKGSVGALIALDLAFDIWLVAFILATVAWCKTFQQVLAVSNLGAIVFASIGGAITPLKTLPSWAGAISPISPTYWAMHGFNSVILDGKALDAVLTPIAVLLGSAVVFAVLAAVRFNFNEAKGGVLPGL
jgi:ABC-2 type transport system permease protein